MKKIIKKIGNSLGIILTKDDAKIYGFKVNDKVEIEIVVLVDDKNKQTKK